jgi:hypothetical protein
VAVIRMEFFRVASVTPVISTSVLVLLVIVRVFVFVPPVPVNFAEPVAGNTGFKVKVIVALFGLFTNK